MASCTEVLEDRFSGRTAWTGALVFVAACGSSAEAGVKEAGATPEAGLQQSAEGGPSTPGMDAALSDDGPPMGVDGSPATNGVEGALAFPVGTVVMGYVVGGCGGNGDAGPGVVPAVQIGMFEVGHNPSFPCDEAGASTDAGVGRQITIGVATTQWATFAGGPLTSSLTAGTYMISNERQDDEDLCMLTDGGSAYLTYGQVGGQSLAIAVSGTVTLDSIAAKTLTGSLDVTMGGPYGQADGGTSHLAGSFNASVPCP